MAIDWEAGRITDEQHRLFPEQVVPIVACLEEGGIAYIDAEELNADGKRDLWLRPHALAYPEEKAEAMNTAVDMCRVVRLPEGFIIDISDSDFELDATSGRAVRADTDFDYRGSDWLPVVGLVETRLEREGLGSILFGHYNVVLGPSVLGDAQEAGEEAEKVEEADERGGPDEGETSV